VGDALIEVATALRRRVMAPLVLGGPIVPLRPVGAARARAVAQAAVELERDELATQIDIGRSRQVRKLAPVDAIDAPGLAEWLMIVAFHDLVQATNPKMAGMLASGRPQKMLMGVDRIVDQVSATCSARDALARHATFARLFEVERLDTRVSWWCGAADFLGRSAPRRLLLLRGLRRVTVQQAPTGFSHFPDSTGLQSDAYLARVSKLLALSPVTDLAAVTRPQPRFVWTRAIAQLMTVPAGRTLALRALRLNDRVQTVNALQRAGIDPRVSGDARCASQVRSAIQELEDYLGSNNGPSGEHTDR
jgi:hypothetical protein